MKMQIYAVTFESYPVTNRNNVGTIVETLNVDIDTNKTEEELLEAAAQILEDRGYWVLWEDSGGRCTLAWEVNGTPVAIVSVAPEALPVWEGERLVLWRVLCPYCGRTLEIDPKDIHYKYGPMECAPWQIGAHCQEECRHANGIERE